MIEGWLTIFQRPGEMISVLYYKVITFQDFTFTYLSRDSAMLTYTTFSFSVKLIHFIVFIMNDHQMYLKVSLTECLANVQVHVIGK